MLPIPQRPASNNLGATYYFNISILYLPSYIRVDPNYLDRLFLDYQFELFLVQLYLLVGTTGAAP